MKSGTDAGKEPMQQVIFEAQMSTTKIICRHPNFVVNKQSSTGFFQELSHYSLVDMPIQISIDLLHNMVFEFF